MPVIKLTNELAQINGTIESLQKIVEEELGELFNVDKSHYDVIHHYISPLKIFASKDNIFQIERLVLLEIIKELKVQASNIQQTLLQYTSQQEESVSSSSSDLNVPRPISLSKIAVRRASLPTTFFSSPSSKSDSNPVLTTVTYPKDYDNSSSSSAKGTPHLPFSSPYPQNSPSGKSSQGSAQFQQTPSASSSGGSKSKVRGSFCSSDDETVSSPLSSMTLTSAKVMANSSDMELGLQLQASAPVYSMTGSVMLTDSTTRLSSSETIISPKSLTLTIEDDATTSHLISVPEIIETSNKGKRLSISASEAEEDSIMQSGAHKSQPIISHDSHASSSARIQDALFRLHQDNLITYPETRRNSLSASVLQTAYSSEASSSTTTQSSPGLLTRSPAFHIPQIPNLGLSQPPTSNSGGVISSIISNLPDPNHESDSSSNSAGDDSSKENKSSGPSL